MKYTLYFFLSLFTLLFIQPQLYAQYPPPAGQPGSTAISRDSNIIIGWAANCTIERGFINMADTTMTYNGVNKATYGSYLYASGPSDEYVVSLGDQGSAILGFDPPIENHAGPDFAVFENSFGDLFLELAFVEVSSDGKNFFRFPAVSLIQQDFQVETFGTLDATLLHNFAGKYRMGYGTPFDLDDMQGISGLDLKKISYVRIVDVGGSIDPQFATYDSQGHKINDPWPTPFETGGFDIDAIGVINNSSKQTGVTNGLETIRIYPNPVEDDLWIETDSGTSLNLDILTPDGMIVHQATIRTKFSYNMSGYPAGIYIARFSLTDGSSACRKIIKK
jgi:hypothetical protein